MDRAERYRADLGGSVCTVCGSRLRADRIRLLAERDDLAFLELGCDRCGAETLGIVTYDRVGGAERPVLDPAPYGEFGPADELRFAGRPPIGPADVERMRAFLAGHRGDLRSLLRPSQEPGAP
ncbi:MAG TPA: hypothetical protein VNJ28_03020 [Candidatus Limnocylindrales bacterium]|nr:hypothetical protein [Candidatus Limnocylindrales bacterium]